MPRPSTQHLTPGHLESPSPTTPSSTATAPPSSHTPMSSATGTPRRALSDEDARPPSSTFRHPHSHPHPAHPSRQHPSSSGSSPSSYHPPLPHTHTHARARAAPPDIDPAHPTPLSSARIKLSSRDQEAMRKLRSSMMEQSISDSGGSSSNANSASASPSSPRFPPGTGAGGGYPPAVQGHALSGLAGIAARAGMAGLAGLGGHAGPGGQGGQGRVVRPRTSTLSRQVTASPAPGSTSGEDGDGNGAGVGAGAGAGREQRTEERDSEEENGYSYAYVQTPVPETPPAGSADYTIAVLGHEGTGKTTFIARALKTWGMSNPVKIYSAGGYMVSSCYSQISPSGKLLFPRKVEFLEMNVQALNMAQVPSGGETGTGSGNGTEGSISTSAGTPTETAEAGTTSLWPGSIRGVSGAIYCYDATRSETLQGLQECLAHLAHANIPTVLLACKSDPTDTAAPTRVAASYGNSLGEPYNVGLIEVTTKTVEGKAKMKNALRWLLYKLEQRQRRQQRIQLETVNIAQALSSSTITETGNGVGITYNAATTPSGLPTSTGKASTTGTSSVPGTASTPATTATTAGAAAAAAVNLESLASPDSDGDSAGTQLMWRQKGLVGLTKRVEEGREGVRTEGSGKEGSVRDDEEVDEDEDEGEDEEDEDEGEDANEEERSEEEVKVEGEGPRGESEVGIPGKGGAGWLASAVGGEKMVKANLGLSQGDPPIYLSIDELMNQLFTTIVTNRDDPFTRTFFLTYRRFCQPRELMHEFFERLKEVEGYAISSHVRNWALVKLTGALIDWTTSYPGDLVTPHTAVHFADIISLLLKYTFMAHLLSDLLVVQRSLPDIVDLDQSWSRRPADTMSHTSTAGSELVIDSEVLYDFDSVKSAEGQGDGEGDGDADSARGGRMGSLGRKAGSTRSTETSSLCGSDPKAGVVSVYPVSHVTTSVSSEERSQHQSHQSHNATTQQQQPQPQSRVARSPQSQSSIPRGSGAAAQPGPAAVPAGLALAGEDMADARWGAAVNMVLRMDQRAFAAELTRMQWELFAAVRPRDAFRHDFGKEVNGPVGKSIMFFNHVSRWVSTIILASHRAKHRARVIERFISIAHHLRRLNNYESLYALISGMRETSIHRLAATHALVQFANNDDDRHFQSHLKLMDARGGYVHYRRALQADISHGRGAIPLLTTILGFVSRMQGVRPEDVRQADGKVQWDKFLRFGEILGIIQECQAKGPIVAGPVNARFKSIMEDTAVIANEDGLWERSQMLEHNGGTIGGKMLKRLVNLGFSS